MEPNSAQSQPASSEQPAPANPVVSTTPPKKSGRYILLLIVCLIVVFLSGIGFEKFHILSFIKRIPLPQVTITMPTPKPTPTPSPTLTPTPTTMPSGTPTATSSASLYTCPPTGYVDCMPVLDDAKKKACAPDAMTWYKANCPNFKGGAL